MLLKTLAKRILFISLACFSIFITSCSDSKKSKDSDCSSCEDPDSPAGKLAQLFNDPLLKEAWHILNVGQKNFSRSAGKKGEDLSVFPVWEMGYLGKGVKVSVVDGGGEPNHPDLKARMIPGKHKNYCLEEPWFGSPYLITSQRDVSTTQHGTAVAGIIGATADNEIGSAGIAPKVEMSISRIPLSGPCEETEEGVTDDMLVDLAGGDSDPGYDIYNYSWGYNQSLVYPAPIAFTKQLKYGTREFRDGKGALYVKSAGNNSQAYGVANKRKLVYFGNANLDGTNTSPYIIIVGAVEATGDYASYSSPGSNLWISGAGGHVSEGAPRIITTDLSGCNLGNSQNLLENKDAVDSAFAAGDHPDNKNCDYTARMNGTSAGSPTVVGVIALMLEANPQLSWRDVKYILANTADNDLVDSHISLPARFLAGLPVDYSLKPKTKWTTNDAGIKFHNLYGFGRVNAEQAVRAAKTHDIITESLEEVEVESDFLTDVKTEDEGDEHYYELSETLTMDDSFNIEAVQIIVDTEVTGNWDCIQTVQCGEFYGIEVISPAGTRSVIYQPFSNTYQGSPASSERGFKNKAFLTNAFFKENSKGEWKIVIKTPLKTESPESTPAIKLKKWSVKVYGTED